MQGAVGWLVAGLLVSALFSLTHGPAAWWLLVAVCPFVLIYGLAAVSETRRRLQVSRRARRTQS